MPPDPLKRPETAYFGVSPSVSDWLSAAEDDLSLGIDGYDEFLPWLEGEL